MGELLLAEDLLLLLLDDERGKVEHSAPLQTALGGAVLAELAMAGAVEIGERTGLWRTAKVHPTGDADPADLDPVLAAALGTVAEKERPAADLVDKLGKGLRDRLGERLAGRGVLRREEDRVLGIFPRTRWPANDQAHEEMVRRDLADALRGELTPTDRTRALVALLSATSLAHRVLDVDGLSRGEVKRRARQIAEGDWAAAAVKDAVEAATAAIVVVTAGAVSSGS